MRGSGDLLQISCVRGSGCGKLRLKNAFGSKLCGTLWRGMMNDFVARSYRVLQCAVVCCSVLRHNSLASVFSNFGFLRALQCVAVRCIALNATKSFIIQCIAVCCVTIHAAASFQDECVAVHCSALRCNTRHKVIHHTVCCSVLQCVAVCCSVLQCVAVCCSVLRINSRTSVLSRFLLFQGVAVHCVVLRATKSCIIQCIVVCCNAL